MNKFLSGPAVVIIDRFVTEGGSPWTEKENFLELNGVRCHWE